MSFQAYLDAIEDKTGKTPNELLALAAIRGYGPTTKAGEVVEWLKEDFGVGRGHAMAFVFDDDLTGIRAVDSLLAMERFGGSIRTVSNTRVRIAVGQDPSGIRGLPTSRQGSVGFCVAVRKNDGQTRRAIGPCCTCRSALTGSRHETDRG